MYLHTSEFASFFGGEGGCYHIPNPNMSVATT